MDRRGRPGNFSAAVPPGSGAGLPFPYHEWESEVQWNKSWTYRRGLCNGSKSSTSVNVGDVTQQNWLNDVDNAYFFLPLQWSPNTTSSLYTNWTGGVNLTAQQMLEQRGYGTYHFLVNTSSSSYKKELALNYSATGTGTGLSKMPYLRDTRRSVGLDHFRLLYDAEDYYNASFPYTAFQFPDRVALGDYFYADMHKLTTCELPQYQWRNETKPFTIPFRALTSVNFSNFLVAGKTMAQSFHANAATRLHPVEWSSGVAAGVAAGLMAERRWSSRRMYENVAVLQDRLVAIGQPMDWTPPPHLPPLQVGFACVSILGGSCVGVTDPNGYTSIYPTSTCNASCRELAPNEWLAHRTHWDIDPKNRSLIYNEWPAELTKSTAAALTLPPSEKISVAAQSSCRLLSPLLVEKEFFVCQFWT